MEGGATHVTKVLRIVLQALASRLFLLALCASCAWAQAAQEKPAEALYLQLGSIGLDPSRVFQVRGASLNRASIQISLDDGTIAFTQDIMGRITGAFFEGDGEILLTPPNSVERRSMSFFTGMAILEERFSTAYFRFNDDAFSELRPDLRKTEDRQDFVQRWNPTVKNLSSGDAMRLLLTFSRWLARDYSLSVRVPATAGRSGTVPVTYFYPYSGQTPPGGVSGRLVDLGTYPPAVAGTSGTGYPPESWAPATPRWHSGR